MNTQTLIICISVLALFIVPFYLAFKTQKSKSKIFEGILKDFASKYHFSVSKFEIWNKIYCIAIDNNSSRIIYLKNNDKTNIQKLINLNELSDCKISKETRVVKDKKMSFEIVESLGLKFIYKTKAKGEEYIEFFDTKETMTISDESQAIENWHKLIVSKIGILSD